MTRKTLILGGYGNFGKRIATALVKSSLPIIIAGRDKEKAESLATTLKQRFPHSIIETAIFDVRNALEEQLEALKPAVVINTCGPFQNSDYTVAETCIRHKVHYIDLADGREFVRDITALNKQAKENGVLVVSGASTVPGLSSAVLDAYNHEFSSIDSLLFGISPGQQAERGLATTQGILTYVGKQLQPFAGHQRSYGWQDIYRQNYPELGKRWMANCDIPDLDLLPERYGIQSIRFSAGMEHWLLHFGIWVLSWCVRLGLPLHLPKYASFLLRVSHVFDKLGTAHGGMHVIMEGKDTVGKKYRRKWFIIAKDGDGPHIPTIPAIILAKKLVAGKMAASGAMPCVGLVTLEEYKAQLQEFTISYYESN